MISAGSGCILSMKSSNIAAACFIASWWSVSVIFAALMIILLLRSAPAIAACDLMLLHSSNNLWRLSCIRSESARSRSPLIGCFNIIMSADELPRI